MSLNPVNLSLRFVLEVVAVVGAVRLGGLLGWAVAAVLVVAWGVFRKPDDPTSSGNAPVPVDGRVRLALEVAAFAVGLLGWWTAGPRWMFFTDAALLVVHHLWSTDRLAWLLGMGDRPG